MILMRLCSIEGKWMAHLAAHLSFHWKYAFPVEWKCSGREFTSEESTPETEGKSQLTQIPNQDKQHPSLAL